MTRSEFGPSPGWTKKIGLVWACCCCLKGEFDEEVWWYGKKNKETMKKFDEESLKNWILIRNQDWKSKKTKENKDDESSKKNRRKKINLKLEKHASMADGNVTNTVTKSSQLLSPLEKDTNTILWIERSEWKVMILINYRRYYKMCIYINCFPC